MNSPSHLSALTKERDQRIHRRIEQNPALRPAVSLSTVSNHVDHRRSSDRRDVTRFNPRERLLSTKRQSQLATEKETTRRHLLLTVEIAERINHERSSTRPPSPKRAPTKTINDTFASVASKEEDKENVMPSVMVPRPTVLTDATTSTTFSLRNLTIDGPDTTNATTTTATAATTTVNGTSIQLFNVTADASTVPPPTPRIDTNNGISTTCQQLGHRSGVVLTASAMKGSWDRSIQNARSSR